MTKRVRKKRWFALVLLGLVLLLFYKSNWLMRLVYPISYKQEIESSAEKYGVDPMLVAAIIRVESNFRPNRKSPKGAIGIMQIMPETAEWIMEKEGDRSFTLEDLRDPATNIRVGTRYIGMLNRQFKDDPVRVIASYNAGPGNVAKWSQNGIWDGRQETVESIPFWETRNYVNKVLYYYKKYESIYKDG